MAETSLYYSIKEALPNYLKGDELIEFIGKSEIEFMYLDHQLVTFNGKCKWKGLKFEITVSGCFEEKIKGFTYVEIISDLYDLFDYGFKIHIKFDTYCYRNY